MDIVDGLRLVAGAPTDRLDCFNCHSRMREAADEITRLRAELARAKSCACADCNTEILQLRAENEATRRIANQLVGALHLALPLSDSTEILLTHAYHRVQEMQYMIRQLAALAAKGE